jgi:hypothetical protein
MTERVKFAQVSRVICPKTGVHYLDAIDENGHTLDGTNGNRCRKVDYLERTCGKKNTQQPYDL